MSPMPRRLLALVPIVAVLALSGCGSDGESSSTLPQSLAGTSWTLTGNGASIAIPVGFGVTANFSEDSVSGNSGCNDYNGTYTATDSGGLTFGPMITTSKACEDNVMTFEQAYLAIFPEVASYQIKSPGTNLLMYNAAGDMVLTFTEAQPGS